MSLAFQTMKICSRGGEEVIFVFQKTRLRQIQDSWRNQESSEQHCLENHKKATFSSNKQFQDVELDCSMFKQEDGQGLNTSCRDSDENFDFDRHLKNHWRFSNEQPVIFQEPGNVEILVRDNIDDVSLP